MTSTVEDALRAAGTAVNAAAVDAQLAVAMGRAGSADHGATFLAWLAESREIGREDTDAMPAKLRLLLVAAARSPDDERLDRLARAIASELDATPERAAHDIAAHAAIAGLLPHLAEVR